MNTVYIVKENAATPANNLWPAEANLERYGIDWTLVTAETPELALEASTKQDAARNTRNDLDGVLLAEEVRENAMADLNTAACRLLALARIESEPELKAHEEMLLADWAEGADHAWWVATANVAEIVDWAVTIEAQQY